MSLTSILANIASNDHVLFLYKDDEERNAAALNCLNKALKNGIHCIYASVSAFDHKSNYSISHLSSKIDNFTEYIESSELQIINFNPYYEAALKVDLSPFNKLKKEFEEKLKHLKSEGKKDAILVFADAACLLSQNKHFVECEILEWWWNETATEWRKNNLNITVICPHPAPVLNRPRLSESRNRLDSVHTLTIDTKQSTNSNSKKDYDNDSTSNNNMTDNKNNIIHQQGTFKSRAIQKKKGRTKRILIVEPEPDIQYIYSLFTRQHGFKESDVNIVDNANKCLEYLFPTTGNGGSESNSGGGIGENYYNCIILDTHLGDISGLEVAQKIRNKLPNKRIILTTTDSLKNINPLIDSIGIKREDVILKPFNYAEFISVIKERQIPYN